MVAYGLCGIEAVGSSMSDRLILDIALRGGELVAAVSLDLAGFS